MWTIALLSLLGIGATAFLIDEFVDDDDPEDASAPETPGTTDPDDEAPVDPDTGEDPDDPLADKGFTVEEQPNGDLRPFINLIATDGDDTIEDADIDAAQDSGSGSVHVLAGDGDDLARLDRDSITINGEDGNDTISNEGEYGNIDGGRGDDVLSGVNSYSIIGREGNDDITIHRSTVDNSSLIDAGTGDDTITHISDIEYYSEGGGAILYGGDGADSFTLDFKGPTGDSPGFGLAPYEDTDEIVQMRDFDPEEDNLVIDLTGIDPDTVIRGIEAEDAEDGSQTELRLLFTKDGEDFSRSIILGPSAVGTDALSHVTVLQPPAPVI